MKILFFTKSLFFASKNTFQVAPAEIEEILLGHEDIADVAIIGVPDDNSGEVPKAFIVKKSKCLTAKMVHLYISSS